MAKGSDFEREVSKYLTEWLTGQKKPYAFWRSPASGALGTISEENANLGGDIVCVTDEAKETLKAFLIECKTGYPKTSFWQHFSNAKTFGIKLFWEQICKSAKKANRNPVLIYRKKGRQPIIGINRIFNEYIMDLGRGRAKGIWNIPNISMTFNIEDHLPSLYFFDMYDFFGYVKPEDFREFGKDQSDSK